MDRNDEIRELMAKLMEAVEVSLATSTHVREALDELARHGLEPRLYFVANADHDAQDAAAPGGAEGEEPALAEGDESEAPGWGAAPLDETPRFELTRLDQDFLKSVLIRPEAG